MVRLPGPSGTLPQAERGGCPQGDYVKGTTEPDLQSQMVSARDVALRQAGLGKKRPTFLSSLPLNSARASHCHPLIEAAREPG